MGGNKLKRFKENLSFDNLLQPEREDLVKDNFLFKGKWSNFFENNNPIVLELGCGKGEYTYSLANKYPNQNFIGIDIKGARIWKGAKDSISKDLKNVCFVRCQIELIDKIFAKNEISEIWLTFPDPQIKYQRRKHRLLNSNFIELYKKIMVKNSLIHLKTDSEFLHGYALGIAEGLGLKIVNSNHDIYQNRNAHEDAINIQTFYEKKFLEKKITYMCFKIN